MNAARLLEKGDLPVQPGEDRPDLDRRLERRHVAEVGRDQRGEIPRLGFVQSVVVPVGQEIGRRRPGVRRQVLPTAIALGSRRAGLREGDGPGRIGKRHPGPRRTVELQGQGNEAGDALPFGLNGFEGRVLRLLEGHDDLDAGPFRISAGLEFVVLEAERVERRGQRADPLGEGSAGAASQADDGLVVGQRRVLRVPIDLGLAHLDRVIGVGALDRPRPVHLRSGDLRRRDRGQGPLRLQGRLSGVAGPGSGRARHRQRDGQDDRSERRDLAHVILPGSDAWTEEPVRAPDPPRIGP